MKGKKLTFVLAAGLSAALLFSGCSFSSAMESLVGTVTETSKETVVSTTSEEGAVIETKKFDKSLQKPKFTVDIAGDSNVALNGKVTIEATATVTDGGKVTYQWYQNNVNSNGGGTAIVGATSASYTPDTSEGGKTFYYVVAINDHGDTINESTSSTHGVSVWDNMYWQQNADNGGYQYLNHADGTFPSNTTMEIDGVSYTFDQNGFAVDPDTGAMIDITTGQAVGAEAETVEAEPAEEAAEEENKEEEQQSEEIVDADGDGVDDAVDDMIDADGDGIPDDQ